MSKRGNPPFWRCPLCLEALVPYGTSPCGGVAFCGNTPNANAHLYLDENGVVKKPKEGIMGIGISEIGNKDE